MARQAALTGNGLDGRGDIVYVCGRLVRYGVGKAGRRE